MKQSFFESLETRRLMSVSLGTNLVVNGDAETGVGSTNFSSVPVPGWKSLGNGASTLVKYGSPFFPDASSPGPADRGAQFFGGGIPEFSGALPTLEQDIDVSSIATDIDAGRIRFDYSAWLGGYKRERDDMVMRIAFWSDTTELSYNAMIGPSVEDRQGLTGFAFRDMPGEVPAGTRKIEIDLVATRYFGRYADGYADNVSLTLSSTAGSTNGLVAGTVFNDADGDGMRAQSESALRGVKVFADTNNNGKLDGNEPSAVTDAAGEYLVANVPAGAVKLRQISKNNFRSTTDAQTVTVEAGLTTTAEAFGSSQAVLISGNVFYDRNGNGRRDAGEMKLPGMIVYLDANNDGHLNPDEISTTTDMNGKFSIVAKSGRQIVRQLLPDSSQQTTPRHDQPILLSLPKGKKSTNNVFGLRPITI